MKNLQNEEKFIFEILAIDKNGQTNITTGESLIYGLLFSESLWKTKEIVEIGDTKKIIDKEQKIELKFHSVDTSSTLNDLIEAAFIIRIKGDDFKQLEEFRLNFLMHLRKKLNFTNIRILRDDISTKISNDIYPLINQVENLLRRYVVKFFTQKIGVDWWDVTAPRSLSEKVSLRKGNEKIFLNLVDTDVTLIDFNDLGELIYKQSSGFNKQENVISRIMNSETIDDLNILKQELQGNYTKYFKTAFQDNSFEKKWKIIFEIRNKVAHNNLFIYDDYEVAKQLVDDLCKIINDAESKIDEFRFSIEEQEALRQVTIEAIQDAEQQNENKEASLSKLGVTMVGSIELPNESYRSYDSRFKIITEEELLNEIQIAESNINYKSYFPYVGLKAFVTKFLATKGYSIGPAYSLINILKDKGVVEIFEPDNSDPSSNFIQPKGLRLKSPSLKI